MMSKARILVVEDEVIIGMEIEQNLLNLGYEVTSNVDTGDDAIQKAEEDNPDLILMDIRIRGDKDGIETAEIIRNKFGIPVIFSTAYLDEERIERAKITMPFGYVLKPIQERDLKVTLEMALYVTKVDAERRRAENLVQKNESRLSALLDIYELQEVGKKEIYDYALESCISLTDSEISFLGFLSDDEETMNLHAWSKSTMKECEVVDKPIHFNIATAGIWAEAVRKRKPIIIDDYSKENPQKMGVPEGHVPLINLLSVPIFDKDKIVSVIAVANKKEGYSDLDTSQLSLLMQGILQILRRKKSDAKSKENESLLKKIAENYPNSYLSIIESDYTAGFTSGNEFKKRGLDPEQFIGLTLEQVFGENEPIIRKHYEATFQGEERTFELFIDNEHQIYKTIPLRSEDGTIQRILSVVENNTERKKAESELQQRKDNLEKAQRISKTGSYDWDLITNEVHWSDGMYLIFGLKKEEIVPSVDGFVNFVHPDDISFVSQDNIDLHSAKEIHELEFRIIDQKTKEAKLIHIWGKTTFDDDGNPVYIYGVLQDISAFKDFKR